MGGLDTARRSNATLLATLGVHDILLSLNYLDGSQHLQLSLRR